MIKTTIIKLGGSIISTKEKLIDFEYLLALKSIIEQRCAIGEKFGIVVGGGYTMRKYRDLAKDEGKITKTIDLHWIGTTVNVLHSEVVRAVFGELADERPFVYEDYYTKNNYQMDRSILVGGGGRAGHSGDVDAIILAQILGAQEIISMKNIDYLYDSDPKQNPEAKKVIEANWNEYLEIIHNKKEHEPGANYVVDPIAARLAQQNKLSFKIINGLDLNNFGNLLNNNPFNGSTIHP